MILWNVFFFLACLGVVGTVVKVLKLRKASPDGELSDTVAKGTTVAIASAHFVPKLPELWYRWTYHTGEEVKSDVFMS